MASPERLLLALALLLGCGLLPPAAGDGPWWGLGKAGREGMGRLAPAGEA